MKKFASVLLFVFLSQTALAQNTEKKVEISATTGYVTGLERDFFETARGFHLGANMYKTNANRLSWDAQVSMNLTSNYETAAAISVLGGGRIYFNDKDKANRYFFNMLVGPSLHMASGDDYIERSMQIGYSGGLYGKVKRILFGVGVERQEVLAFKIGYTI